jgi:hypothetical protein
MISPFSIRHQEVIYNKKLKVSFPKRLNKRIWMILERLDFEWVEYTETGANYYVNTLSKTIELIKEVYGKSNLIPNVEENKTELQQFIETTYPSKVLDVVEIYYYVMNQADIDLFDKKEKVTKTVNKAFEDERISWRLSEGKFYQIDYDFFIRDVTEKTYSILKEKGFEGACDEYTQAKKDFKEHNYKSSILNSCKSMESILKTILDIDEGNASYLLSKLKDSRFIEDLAEEYRGGFTSQVLMAVPFLRNKLGGHGQGNDRISVSVEYAELALNLSSSIILFLLQKHSLEEHKEDNFEDKTLDDWDEGFDEEFNEEDFDVPF